MAKLSRPDLMEQTLTMTASVAQPPMKETDPHWKAFEEFVKTEAAGQPEWLLSLRKAGISRFVELGFPTTHDEDWRFTNVAPIVRLPFKPLLAASATDLALPQLESLPFERIESHRLV